MNIECATIITIKDRKEHFLKTFPFMVSQYGTPYEVVFVDFHSNDGFAQALEKECKFRKDTFSPFLKRVKCIKLLDNMSFNPREARNLGASYYRKKDIIFSFCDADVFMGMTYTNYWSGKVKEHETYVTARVQESRASLPRRIKPEINYGNFLVHSSDYFQVNGFDERVGYYGGDDDDIYHRLKLLGIREINPHDEIESRQYSILHGDELRISNFEDKRKVDVEKELAKIYNNKFSYVSENKFIDFQFTKDISREEILYEF